ncbi:unnamed protein product [Sphagnum tenellum]
MAMSDSPRFLSWPLPTPPTPTQSSSEKINPYHAAYIRQPPLFPTKGDVKGSSSSTTSSVSQIRDLLPLRLDSWTKNNCNITDQNLETRLGVLENALENGLGALENTFKNGLGALENALKNIADDLLQVPLVARTPTMMAIADGENHRGTLELTMADGKNDSTVLDQGLPNIGLTLSGPEDFPEVGLTASGLEESENTIREIWDNMISIEDTTQAIQSNNRKMEKMRKIKAKKARIATGQ